MDWLLGFFDEVFFCSDLILNYNNILLEYILSSLLYNLFGKLYYLSLNGLSMDIMFSLLEECFNELLYCLMFLVLYILDYKFFLFVLIDFLLLEIDVKLYLFGRDVFFEF